ncbi:hypothetical protein UFOVP359_10 [uncultured Caudovirales phage]|jgi:hypothetical protein|uniref:Uncharacterized protein n=1 Tax=uncultured Caudovirales phage TaxID=2100421 RepID=A0A6J7WVA4_9CAUD|nr:hypothetical protein UFOVP359_10 [uncultured Caudovirales phage]
MVDLDSLVCKEVLWMLIERYGYDFLYTVMVDIGTYELPDYLEILEEMRKHREDEEQ